MTPEELYYIAKDPHLWPGQRTAVLTQTPPDTPTSANDMEMEELSSHYVVEEESKEEADIQFRPRIQLNYSHQHTPKQKRPFNPLQSKNLSSSHKKQPTLRESSSESISDRDVITIL
jgi:hypothetical protein